MSQIWKTLSPQPGDQFIDQIDGDTGFITGKEVTIYANRVARNSGVTVGFDNSGIISVLNLSDPQGNTMLGNLCGNTGMIQGQNTGVGFDNYGNLVAGGSNTCIGTVCLPGLVSGSFNIAIGANAGQFSTGSWNNNIAIGQSSGGGAGSNNILMGTLAGNIMSGTDSNNIYISNIGPGGESNVIRIGTQGTGNFQQNQCFLAGVLNTVSGRVVNTTSAIGGSFTTDATMHVIFVNASVTHTIILMANPVIGQSYRIKDTLGTCGTNNITILPTGATIDFAANKVMNSNFESLDIVCQSATNWSVF